MAAQCDGDGLQWLQGLQGGTPRTLEQLTAVAESELQCRQALAAAAAVGALSGPFLSERVVT